MLPPPNSRDRQGHSIFAISLMFIWNLHFPLLLRGEHPKFCLQSALGNWWKLWVVSSEKKKLWNGSDPICETIPNFHETSGKNWGHQQPKRPWKPYEWLTSNAWFPPWNLKEKTLKKPWGMEWMKWKSCLSECQLKLGKKWISSVKQQVEATKKKWFLQKNNICTLRFFQDTNRSHRSCKACGKPGKRSAGIKGASPFLGLEIWEFRVRCFGVDSRS